MAESYCEMTVRHDAMDDQIHRRRFDDRWAGPNEYVEVAAPEPAPIRDCTNCLYAGASREASGAGYWCKAHQRSVFVDGKAGCSGWPWAPKDGVAA